MALDCPVGVWSRVGPSYLANNGNFRGKKSNIGKAHRWGERKTILFNIENLVLRARSDRIEHSAWRIAKKRVSGKW